MGAKKKSNCDANILDSSKSKIHVDSGESNYLIEEINMLSYFTSTRGEIFSYGKGIFVGSRTIGMSPNPTFEFDFSETLGDMSRETS